MQPKHNRIILIAGLILAAAVISTIFGLNTGQRIGVYTGNREVRKYTEPETGTKEARTFDKELVEPFPIHLSVAVPAGWIQTVEDNMCTFVHRESGAAIRLQMLPYDPAINNISEQSLASYVVKEGKTYVGFQRLSNTSYELYYSDIGVDTYDYIEEVTWDRQHIVKYICICNDRDYSEMQEVFADSYSSLNWEKEDPVPDMLVLLYDQEYQYEYAVPIDWYVSGSDGLSYAQSSDGHSSLTVTAVEYTGNIEEVTVDDITALLDRDGNKSNFLLRNYEITDGRGYVLSTYTDMQAVIQERTMIYPCNGICYVEMFSYIQGTLDETFVETCLNLFRSFLKEPIESETSAVSEEELYQQVISNAIQNAETEIEQFVNGRDQAGYPSNVSGRDAADSY